MANKKNHEDKKDELEKKGEIKDEENNEKEVVAKLEKELKEAKNDYLRLAADFDNFRKRTIAAQSSQKEFITIYIINEFLPLADNYELALKYLDEKSKTGVMMIYRQLLDVFAKFDVKEMDVIGKHFDPKYHEAVEKVENSETESNTIVEVTQKGYMIGNEVLRCALVKVAE